MGCGQYVDPKDAKILKEQRFNAGDGRFGSAFAQEDGTVYREETTADGERIGQYSYIDNDGKKITVKYTAGINGFRIIEGDHVPTGATGQGSAPFVAKAAPAPVAAAAPVVQRAPLPRIAAVQETVDYDYLEYYEAVDTPADVNANPFINPYDPTHSNFQYNTNCANFAGVNPFINPFDASHLNPQQFVQRAPVQQQFQPAPVRQAPVQQQFRQAPVQNIQPAFNFQSATEAPRKFFAPGQLKLNRFESGFNFDFTSQ